MPMIEKAGNHTAPPPFLKTAGHEPEKQKQERREKR